MVICMEWEECSQHHGGCTHARPHPGATNCHRACGTSFKAVCMEASDEVLVFFKLGGGKAKWE